MRATVSIAVGLFVCGMLVGCSGVTKMTPTSGPPGTPVKVKCCNTFGDPSARTVYWDGKKLADNFCGSFVVPECEPGVYTITVQDDVDANEAFLIFPLMRSRWARAEFTVTEPLVLPVSAR
jgi:hypothetical protein